MVHLCLNMICKNESKVISRLLKSVASIINSYVIVDTGSTDDTKEIIKKTMDEYNIHGIIINEPFINFSYNRNHALKMANLHGHNATHYLLLDADMILEVYNTDQLLNEIENNDLLYLFQGSSSFKYQNVRIVKKSNEVEYKGATHEYINFPNHFKKYTIPIHISFICDIGDGGSKSNKYERDIQLLLGDIEKEPNNTRSYFYLGNSYADNNQPEKAIEQWKKRVEMGGWVQEIWYSLYRIGTTYLQLNKPELAIQSWLEAINYCPMRIENLYEIIKYYRTIGQNHTAYLFYKSAKNILQNLNENNKLDFLFLHDDIYQYRLDYEFSILAHYVNETTNIELFYTNLINSCQDDYLLRNILSNMKYYIYKPNPIQIIDLNMNFTHDNKTFRSSSCSFLSNLINIRFVNYYINEKGQYLDCQDQICTLNKCFELNTDFTLGKELQTFYPFPEEKNRKYAGIEDVRLFTKDNELKFMGTGFLTNDKLGIIYGDYDISQNSLDGFVLQPNGFKLMSNECEKNWVATGDGIEIIYNWFPMQIGMIFDETCIKMRQIELPNIFKNARGSTCGFIHNNECWYIVHFVSYETPRHYYHMIVVFDEDTTQLFRYTPLFKLSYFPIEYTTSFQIINDKIIIGYSTMDRETKIAIYNKNDFQYILN